MMCIIGIIDERWVGSKPFTFEFALRWHARLRFLIHFQPRHILGRSRVMMYIDTRSKSLTRETFYVHVPRALHSKIIAL